MEFLKSLKRKLQNRIPELKQRISLTYHQVREIIGKKIEEYKPKVIKSLRITERKLLRVSFGILHGLRMLLLRIVVKINKICDKIVKIDIDLDNRLG